VKQTDNTTAGTKTIQSILFEEHQRLAGDKGNNGKQANIVEAKMDTEEMQ
jgi:hypothetical protein